MSVPPLHIAAVMGLVRRGDDVLMIDSPRRGWECPGGQVEVGEDPLAALHREIEEETGIRCRVSTLAAVNSNVGKQPYSVQMPDFLCEFDSGKPRPSAESRRVCWMTPEEALEAVDHPSMAARLAHLLAFDGRVRMHAYRLDPYVVVSEQLL